MCKPAPLGVFGSNQPEPVVVFKIIEADRVQSSITALAFLEHCDFGRLSRKRSARHEHRMGHPIIRPGTGLRSAANPGGPVSSARTAS
jgi:hypothetical protein